jgi:lysophospholipase L1-like esterase
MDVARVPANARSSVNDPAQQVERAINGVHPADSGQAQIADAMWSWLKFRTSLR